MVAEHEPGATRAGAGPLDLDVASDEGVLDAVHTLYAAPLEHDRMLDLGVDELAVGGDRGVRTDVGVDEARSARR